MNKSYFTTTTISGGAATVLGGNRMLKTSQNYAMILFIISVQIKLHMIKKITNNWVVYIKPVTQQGQSTVFMAGTFLSTFDFDGNSYGIQNSLANLKLVKWLPM